MTDERLDETDQTQADAAALHDESRQDEEGNRQQNVVACAVHHVLRQHHERCCAARPRGRPRWRAAGRTRQERPPISRRRKRMRAAMIGRRRPEHGSHDRIVPAAAAGREEERGHAGSATLPCVRQKRSAPQDRNERHANGSGDSDQRVRDLQDRRSLAPVRGDEFDRDDAGQPADKKDNDIGERQANGLDSLRGNVQESAGHEHARAADRPPRRRRKP